MSHPTFGQLLVDAVERVPTTTALIVDDRPTRYDELLEGALTYARAFRGLGVRRGDHVGLLLPNSEGFVLAFLGLQLLGAVAVPINTRFRTRELGHVVRDAGLCVLVTSDLVVEHVDLVGRVAETLPELAAATEPRALTLTAAPQLRTVVLLGDREVPGMLTRERFLAAGTGQPDTDLRRGGDAAIGAEDTAMMLYTSGTTAYPKGCLLTHDGVIHVWTSVARTLGITAEDRIWDALPMFHMSCLGPLTFTLWLGTTLITATHFDPGQALAAIERHEATWLYTVFPPIVMGLITHPDFATCDRSRVRALLNVAPPDTMELIQDAFAPAEHIGGHFGMTEASGAITCNPNGAPHRQRLHTTGTVLPETELEVRDADGAPVPPDTRGELWIRGRGLFRGYHGDEAGTREAFRDGWFRTGDLGEVDAAGNVTYHGRLKDMLKVGGENLAPAEVESHLSLLPAVKLVQVVGVPDERLGEVPAAFIELVDGASLTAEEVVAHCDGAIASFKVPRYVRFVTEWPMSATKIQRFRLQAEFAELAARGEVARLR